MKQLMRYNRYKTDPLSYGEPEESIAGRFDLISTLKEASPNGAIDAKVVSLLKDFDEEGHQFSPIEVIGGIVVNEECLPFTNYELFHNAGIGYEGIFGLDGQSTWFQTKSEHVI